MLRFLLITTLIFFYVTCRSQDKVTLNGYVKDADNGEELIGVTIYIPQLKAGTVTNDYGFYALTVPKGSYEIRFSYMGYKEDVRTLDLKSDMTLNLSMQ